MRIFHWIPTSNLGGCEILLSSFVDAIDVQVEHVIFTTKEGEANRLLWNKENVQIVYIKEWGSLNPISWVNVLRKKLIDFEASKLICWSPSRIPFIKRLVKTVPNLRCLVHVGSLVCTSRLKTIQQKGLDFILGNGKSDNIKLIACSEYVRMSLLRDRYFSDIESFAVLNCVRNEIFNNSKEKESISMNICTLGRLDPVKRHSEMIDFVVAAKNRGVNCNFNIYGGGGEAENLSNRIQKYCAQDYIKLKGAVSDVSKCLSENDIFIFNSTELEGMGISLAEAMCCGLICVTNDSILMHEMLDDLGYYFKNEKEFIEILEKISDNPNEQKKRSSQIRELALQKFSSKKWVNSYMKQLKEWKK